MVTKKNIKQKKDTQKKDASQKAQPEKVEANNNRGKPDSVKYPVIFNEWETNGHQMFRVVADTYKGRVLHSIRKYWQDRDDTWQPGKGATIDYEDIDDIISGLQKMKKWMEEHPKGE